MSGGTNRPERRHQRWNFGDPLAATLGGHHVRLLDLSVSGAGLEHDMPFTNGREAVFEFGVGGVTVAAAARIVRCRLSRREPGGKLVYRSGLQFVDDTSGVRKVMTHLVMRARTPAAQSSHAS